MFFVVLLLCSVILVEGHRSCGQPADKPEIFCKLKPEKGYCRAFLPRFRYDPHTGDCVDFVYGGCCGNGNNFETYEECIKVCKGS